MRRSLVWVVMIAGLVPAGARAQPRLGPIPDLRIDEALLRARAAAEDGEPELALGIVEELASRPTCPPLTWDRDGAMALLARVDGLPSPYTHRPWMIGGGVSLGLGGALAIGTGLVFAFDGASILGGGRRPRSVPDEAYGGLWGGAVLLVVTGIALLVHGSDVLNPPHQRFEERRARMIDRIRPPHDVRGLEPFPAFGHRVCDALTASRRSASRATALADTRTSRRDRSR